MNLKRNEYDELLHCYAETKEQIAADKFLELKTKSSGYWYYEFIDNVVSVLDMNKDDIEYLQNYINTKCSK